MKTRQSILVILVVLLAQGLALAKDKNHYVFTSFDPPGSVVTYPVGINNNGLVAIQYGDQDGGFHAVLLKHGKYTEIAVPDALATLPGAPNMQGQIPLTYLNSADYYWHPALYWKGQFTFLPDAPGFLNNSMWAINARGHACGLVFNDGTVVDGYVWDGATYNVYVHPGDNAGFTACYMINDRGQIIGEYDTSDGVVHGYLRNWNRDNYTEIAVPDSPNTVPYGINNSGVIVGLYGKVFIGPWSIRFGDHGFMLRKGIYSTLDYPGAVTSFPTGINDRDEIVGVYLDAAGTIHGYFATPKHRK